MPILFHQLIANIFLNMSHPFFEYETLETGTQLMVQSIKKCYSDMAKRLVSPPVEPGFLRHSLPQAPSEEGKSMKQIIESTEKFIVPGLMYWQSPKFFGYYPSLSAVSSVMAEMFATAFHSPAFVYSVSPAHTELQNIQMDWVAIALGLPECFLLKNSGGGIINSSTTESVYATVHAAKKKKMSELSIEMTDPRIVKLVGYFSEIAHNGGERGLLLKEIAYRRAVRVSYSPERKNYEIDLKHFEELVEQDIKNGLIPFWFGLTHGSTLSGSSDISQQLIDICKKHKIWMNLDAAYLGPSWICPEYRLPQSWMREMDSICLNFSKAMMIGTGGSVMFIKDKRQFNKAFGGTSQFSFYKNKYSGRQDVVDYKDWFFGEARRNNGIKFYFLFEHYGLKMLRKLVEETALKSLKLKLWVQEDSEIFEFFCRQWGLVCFKVKDKEGNPSNELTNIVYQAIRNIPQGYLSPGVFKEDRLIRIVIGNYHGTIEIIKDYYEKIKQKAVQVRNSS